MMLINFNRLNCLTLKQYVVTGQNGIDFAVFGKTCSNKRQITISHESIPLLRSHEIHEHYSGKELTSPSLQKPDHYILVHSSIFGYIFSVRMISNLNHPTITQNSLGITTDKILE